MPSLRVMDVQMSVTDGLDATRAIRALERERGIPPIPIIALTANASSQDIGAVLLAAMLTCPSRSRKLNS